MKPKLISVKLLLPVVFMVGCNNESHRSSSGREFPKGSRRTSDPIFPKKTTLTQHKKGVISKSKNADSEKAEQRIRELISQNIKALNSKMKPEEVVKALKMDPHQASNPIILAAGFTYEIHGIYFQGVDCDVWLTYTDSTGEGSDTLYKLMFIPSDSSKKPINFPISDK